MPLGLLKYGLSQDFPFEKDPDLPYRPTSSVSMTLSSLAVAVTEWRLPITSPNIMALPTSRCWKRAIWVVATRRETRRHSL